MLYKTEIKQNHTSMLHCFLKIYAYSESYGGNMLQTSCDRRQQKTEYIVECSKKKKKTLWNIPQFNRLIGNRWSCDDWVGGGAQEVLRRLKARTSSRFVKKSILLQGLRNTSWSRCQQTQFVFCILFYLHFLHSALPIVLESPYRLHFGSSECDTVRYTTVTIWASSLLRTWSLP